MSSTSTESSLQIATSSDWESEVSSCAVTDAQFSQLQTDILDQGRQIESYIAKNSRKKKMSETFRALETLFKLFKSELSMNLALRRALITQKEESEKMNKKSVEIREVMRTAEEISGFRFRSMDDLYAFLKETMNEKEIHREKVRRLQRTNDQLKEEKVQLEAQTASEIDKLRNMLDEREQAIEDLKNQSVRGDSSRRDIESKNIQLESQISMQNREINEKNKQIEDLKSEIAALKASSVDLQDSLVAKDKKKESELQQLRDRNLECERRESRLKKDLEESEKMVSTLKSEKKELINKIEDLKVKISTLEQRQQKFMSEVRRQETDERYSKLHNQYLDLQSEYELDREQHKRKVKQLEKTIQALEHENEDLSMQISESRRRSQPCRYENDDCVSSTSDCSEAVTAMRTLCDDLGFPADLPPKEIVKRVVQQGYSQKRAEYTGETRRSNRQSYPPLENDLQAQIDALQEEILSLDGLVTKYSI